MTSTLTKENRMRACSGITSLSVLAIAGCLSAARGDERAALNRTAPREASIAANDAAPRAGGNAGADEGERRRTATDASAGAGSAPPLRGHEVINIWDLPPPAVLPKPKNWIASKSPPYSDRAILTNAWTRAWLLLDLDARGVVTRFKFLRRPGYDLEPIASREVGKLRFEPARDANGKPTRTMVVWKIEWPSAWWLSDVNGTRSAMPKICKLWHLGIHQDQHREDAHVPCAGSGPWIGRAIYRDCSRPDQSKALTEPWIVPAR